MLVAEIVELLSQKIGRVSYEEDSVYHLPFGLFGFEQEKSFVLVQTENVRPFIWFQSLRSGSLAFLLCDPKVILPDYHLELPGVDVSDIDLQSADDALIYVILNIPGDMSRMTANLQGPLILNKRARMGKQMIIEGASLRHPVFQECQPA